MCAFQSLSNAVPKVAGKIYSRKYIALGRVITYWADIIGEEMAQKTQPLKIHYRKPKKKNDKPQATLEIAASSAESMTLQYRKGVILERINQIFGDSWITDLKFSHQPVKKTQKRVKTIKPLTGTQKDYLSNMLNEITDPELQQKLQDLGSGILQSEKNT